MKATSTPSIKNLILNFDSQLLAILKDDLSSQNQKIKSKLVNMATRSYDKELLEIIKSDIQALKSKVNTSGINLAQAV